MNGEAMKNPKVAAFVSDLIAVYKKHGMSISHEDGHGSFVVESFRESNVEWMRDATDNTAETFATKEFNS